MTAIHLFNRLPSKTIGLRNPTEILEKLYPTVRLQNGLLPRVFGCLGYVHSHNMHSNKLSAKALNCLLDTLKPRKGINSIILPQERF